MTYFLIIVFGCLIAFLWVFFFNKFKILDKPWPDIIPKRNPVPNIQGVFLFFWVISSILIFFPEYFQSKELLAFLVWWFIIFVVSLLDSFWSVPAYIRLFVQSFVALIAFFLSWVGIYEISVPFFGLIEFHWVIALIFTIAWFVLFMNAINWFDWVNSLASWVSSIWFLSIILLIKFVVFPNYDVAEKQPLLEMVVDISFILFVFSLVYSVVEFKPWWVLRDIGVMFLGFALAYLALLGGAKIWTIVVALSLMIFDAFWVFINRIIVKKKNPLKWDYTHLHHRLLTLNRTRTETRFFIRGWSIFLMLVMILLWDDRVAKYIMFVVMFLLFFGINSYLFWVKNLPYEYLKKDKTD